MTGIDVDVKLAGGFEGLVVGVEWEWLNTDGLAIMVPADDPPPKLLLTVTRLSGDLPPEAA